MSVTKKQCSEYEELYRNKDGGVEARKAHYARLINLYYDLVTDFYEYGWGSSFHFAPRHSNEGFRESLARHEYFLAMQTEAGSGDKVVDLGCGIGGPMRNIARHTGAHITGVNNNAYQLKRCAALNQRQGMHELCSQLKADFMSLPCEDAAFDHAYEIEATCHAPDRVRCFREVYRVLKPGATFCGYEWCVTDAYQASNPLHVNLRQLIEEGNSLPELVHHREVVESLEKAGFEVEASCDLAEQALERGNDISWWSSLYGNGCSLETIKHSSVGAFCTHQMLRVLETVHLVPEGTIKVHEVLLKARDGVRLAGKLGIFTPMFFFKARKPASA